jgi:hypothetical protein
MIENLTNITNMTNMSAIPPQPNPDPIGFVGFAIGLVVFIGFMIWAARRAPVSQEKYGKRKKRHARRYGR